MSLIFAAHVVKKPGSWDEVFKKFQTHVMESQFLNEINLEDVHLTFGHQWIDRNDDNKNTVVTNRDVTNNNRDVVATNPSCKQSSQVILNLKDVKEECNCSDMSATNHRSKDVREGRRRRSDDESKTVVVKEVNEASKATKLYDEAILYMHVKVLKSCVAGEDETNDEGVSSEVGGKTNCQTLSNEVSSPKDSHQTGKLKVIRDNSSSDQKINNRSNSKNNDHGDVVNHHLDVNNNNITTDKEFINDISKTLVSDENDASFSPRDRIKYQDEIYEYVKSEERYETNRSMHHRSSDASNNVISDDENKGGYKHLNTNSSKGQHERQYLSSNESTEGFDSDTSLNSRERKKRVRWKLLESAKSQSQSQRIGTQQQYQVQSTTVRSNPPKIINRSNNGQAVKHPSRFSSEQERHSNSSYVNSARSPSPIDVLNNHRLVGSGSSERSRNRNVRANGNENSRQFAHKDGVRRTSSIDTNINGPEIIGNQSESSSHTQSVSRIPRFDMFRNQNAQMRRSQSVDPYLTTGNNTLHQYSDDSVFVLSSKVPNITSARLRERRPIPDVRNMIRRIRSGRNRKLGSFWFPVAPLGCSDPRYQRSFHTQSSMERYNIDDFENDCKHYYVFRSLPKVVNKASLNVGTFKLPDVSDNNFQTQMVQ